jgi:hypothetical protein
MTGNGQLAQDHCFGEQLAESDWFSLTDVVLVVQIRQIVPPDLHR